MAAHEYYGTVLIYNAPTTANEAARKAEVDSASTEDRKRSNHTGTQTADTLVDGTTNVVYTATMRTKLAGIAAGATQNSSDATLLNRANHTGTQSADTVVDGSTNVVFTAVNRSKLGGIATGATANDTDANLKNRANHTGSQLASTISDFTSAVNSIVQQVIGAAPTTLDTLKEIADALANDPAFATTMTNRFTANEQRIAALEASSGAGNAKRFNVGDGTATSFTVTHNFATYDVGVEVVRVSDGQTVYPVVRRPSTNTITVDYGTFAPANAAMRVLIDPR